MKARTPGIDPPTKFSASWRDDECLHHQFFSHSSPILQVESQIKSLFPEKYEVLVIEDPDADDYESPVHHNPCYYWCADRATAPWLHGNITRDESELRIMNMKLNPPAKISEEAAGRSASKGRSPTEGTYLVRSKGPGE